MNAGMRGWSVSFSRDSDLKRNDFQEIQISTQTSRCCGYRIPDGGIDVRVVVDMKGYYSPPPASTP